MKLRITTVDGVELNHYILDILVWEREVGRKLLYAASFSEAVSVLFTTRNLDCKEVGEEVVCEISHVKLRVRRGEGKEIVITVDEPFNRLLNYILFKLFDMIRGAEDGINYVHSEVRKVRKQVRVLRKIANRLLWLRW